MTLLTDGGAAARERAERHFEKCEARTMTAPPCDAHALATDVLALLAMLRVREQECRAWQEASETWKAVEQRLSSLQAWFDTLVAAARTTSHGDHDYDPDSPTPSRDCILCAAIEGRYQPAWMDEPYEFIRDPIVQDPAS